MATTTPRLEDSRAAWDEARDRESFWHEHYAEFLQRYPDHFVAVRDGQVLAWSRDHDDLMRQLNGLGLGPTDVWVRFITADPRRLMH